MKYACCSSLEQGVKLATCLEDEDMAPVTGMNHWFPQRICKRWSLLQPCKVNWRSCHSKGLCHKMFWKLIPACVKHFTYSCNTEVKHHERPQWSAGGTLLSLGQQLNMQLKFSSFSYTKPPLLQDHREAASGNWRRLFFQGLISVSLHVELAWPV